MRVQTNHSPKSPLPIRRSLASDYRLSAMIAVLMGIASLGGLLAPSFFYSGGASAQTFAVNDAINLVLGLPILLGSLWLTRRGSLAGLLCWPGALVYVLYNYLAYIFGAPLSAATLLFVALVLLSTYNFTHLIRSLARDTIGERLKGSVPAIVSGLVLLVFGAGFLSRAVAMLVDVYANQAALPPAEIGTLIADLLLSSIWITGGISLVARRPLGYASGLGLLFSTITLIAGLILFLLIEPVFSEASVVLGDVIAVGIFGLISIIPFTLYLRGVISKGT